MSSVDSEKWKQEIPSFISEAMQIGYSSVVNAHIDSLKYPPRLDNPTPQVLQGKLRTLSEFATAAKCQEASLVAISHLWSKYEHSQRKPFNKMFLLNVQGDVFNQHWMKHFGVVLQDDKGSWHFFSPANDQSFKPHYIPNDPGNVETNPLFVDFTSSSIEGLMKKLDQAYRAQKITTPIFPSGGKLEAALDAEPVFSLPETKVSLKPMYTIQIPVCTVIHMPDDNYSGEFALSLHEFKYVLKQ